MKKILLISLAIIGFTNVLSQNLDLSRSHSLSITPVYLLDFMQVDSTTLFSLGLEKKDIRRIKTKVDTITITTKLLVILDNERLDCREKQERLSIIINMSKLDTVVKIGRSDAVRKYGKTGRKGVLIISTIGFDPATKLLE